MKRMKKLFIFNIYLSLMTIINCSKASNQELIENARDIMERNIKLMEDQIDLIVAKKKKVAVIKKKEDYKKDIKTMKEQQYSLDKLIENIHKQQKFIIDHYINPNVNEINELMKVTKKHYKLIIEDENKEEFSKQIVDFKLLETIVSIINKNKKELDEHFAKHGGAKAFIVGNTLYELTDAIKEVKEEFKKHNIHVENKILTWYEKAENLIIKESKKIKNWLKKKLKIRQPNQAEQAIRKSNQAEEAKNNNKKLFNKVKNALEVLPKIN
jgi:hypothetical protein